MPMPDGTAWVYTPQEMSSLSQLDYTYDSLPIPAPAPAAALLAERLTRLGATAAAARVTEGAPVTTGRNIELVGANQEALDDQRCRGEHVCQARRRRPSQSVGESRQRV